MNPNDRLDLFKRALDETRRRLAKEPASPPLVSVERQLEYLLDLAAGRRTDRERMGDVIIGVYAAREFEPDDMEFANLLYEVMDEVEAMKFGR